ncbi:PD-(D/E)XK nuclease family protein [Polaromonas sp.]|uniref:RecB family exonuclease n=1 Tax=Polaromonas sp. TaxID=1869339 RepID=UPI003266FA96
MSEHPVIVVRASAWPTLFDCPHRFYWQNVYGLRSPSAGRAALGTAIHGGTAAYDQAALEGNPISVLDAVDASRELIAHPEDEVVWDADLTMSDADQLATTLTTKYCHDIAPDHQFTAVELQCEALDVETAQGIVRLTGKTDRIRVLEDGRKGIVDLKSGATATVELDNGERRANTKGHHMQQGVYTLMAEQSTQERMDAPAMIIGLQTTKKTPVAVGEMPDVKTALLGMDGMPGLIEMAAAMGKSGSFPPNPKSMLCSAKYCPAHAHHCKYHD